MLDKNGCEEQFFLQNDVLHLSLTFQVVHFSGRLEDSNRIKLSCLCWLRYFPREHQINCTYQDIQNISYLVILLFQLS